MDWGARQNDGQKQNRGDEKNKKMTDEAKQILFTDIHFKTLAHS